MRRGVQGQRENLVFKQNKVILYRLPLYFFILHIQPDEAPPFEDKIIKHKYWIVTEQVDKSQLREEVQQFCDKFPVYRLLEVDLNATYGERTRFGKTV